MAEQPSLVVVDEEKEKMLRGELYRSFGPVLVGERLACRALLKQLNEEIDTEDMAGRQAVLSQLFGSVQAPDALWVEPPFKCDYGYNIHVGTDVFINFNCCILDCNTVHIGSRVLFGPNVQIFTAGHPLDPELRSGTKGPEFARPIVIGDDVWLGGGCIILPGVTVGKGVTVGAGSVVTKDVPPYSVVAGNPARVLRKVQPGSGAVDGKDCVSQP